MAVSAAVLDRATGGTHQLGTLRVVGLIVGIIGVAVLAGPSLSGGHAWPIAQVLLVATCYAIAPLIAARPPMIGSLMLGAEITVLSTMIALSMP